MLCTPTVMLLLVANLQIVTSLQVYIKSNKVLISKSTTPLHSNSIQVDMADFLISTAFSIKPLFKVASKKARDSIINQGAEIGVDWYANVAKLESRKEELEVEFQKLRIPSMQYPDYFLKPFHAYDEGNMSWQAAVELESAALSVHATVYSTTTSGKRELRRDGDFMLRDNFHSKMKEMFLEANFTPTSIIDLGCSSGLSTLKLHDSFPSARVIGMDLSPYYLSVANLQLRTLCASALVEYQHGLAEDTGLARGEVDLVTMCLVAHELPTQALRYALVLVYCTYILY